MEAISKSEANFFKMFQSKVKLVCLYENLNLLKYAVDLVPVEDLNVKAMLNLSVLEETDKTIGFKDLLLIELLNWFKFSFFTWVDTPKCESCGEVCKSRGKTLPDESEKLWLASFVELYFCPKCELDIRFPRYNHPRKLLETRKGRCGEWANCFTFICRALGYDARFVYDWNDHVWTEVFSFNENKWLHCDPCENICDKPLIYEIGWKKPMSYVIAFSKDETQDVTWRYTSNFQETMHRRKLCREEWLLSIISTFNKKLQMNVSPERRIELCKRRALELAQFLTEPKVNDEIFGDRSSGSLAWRIARGEASLPTSHSSYVFNLCDKEIQEKYFHVKYSCSEDKYIRVSNGSTEYDNWNICSYEYNNICRKVEKDWKMVYLARTEGSDKAIISWKFHFVDTGLVINLLKINIGCETFENGKVKWHIFSDSNTNTSESYIIEGPVSLCTTDFQGLTSLTISAELTEGKGQCAWQHTQLFRQDIDSGEFPFDVSISFVEKH